MTTDAPAQAAPRPSEKRVREAASAWTSAAELDALAMDDAVTVRAAAALNPQLPELSERRLAADPDERVRMLIARKLTHALPGLSGPAQAALRERTLGILAALVHDEAVRIRAVIAEAVAGLDGIPHGLVMTLAQDHAAPVSEPVLRLSPMLSTADLLALLSAPPHAEAAVAIACRPHLPERVTDAIATTASSPAIRALLSNGSAAIQEGTLDALVGRAAGRPDWHGPLVRRPNLSRNAAMALAEIVASNLLEELAVRTDLPEEAMVAVRRHLAAKLDGDQPPPPALLDDAALLAEAARLNTDGALTEHRLLSALNNGEDRRAAAMLAVAASVSLAMVDHACALRSAKALVSLVWKSGFSMRAAGPVQTALGQIGPESLIAPAANGHYPHPEAEMRWQLEFLAGCCGHTSRP